MTEAYFSEGYHVASYWGARQESAEACARRVRRFFQALAGCDPALRQWYTSGRGARGTPVDTDLPALKELLLEGRNRTDRGNKVIEDLGFMLLLWNEEEPHTRLNITCGAWTHRPPNYCLIGPPRSGETARRLVNQPMLEKLLRLMVEVWEPDSGVVDTDNHMLLASEHDKESPRVGWATYLSHRLGPVPALPEGVRVEPVGEQGTLLVLPVERFTVEDAGLVALAAEVRARLRQAGMRSLYKP